MRMSVVLGLVLVALSMAATACGRGSFLGTALDKKVAAVDAQFRSGDIAGGCAGLSALLPDLAEWTTSMRGNRTGPAFQAVNEMQDLTLSCSAPQPGGDVAARWTAAHETLRTAAAHKSGWGTVLWWGLILGVVIAFAIFMKRLRS